MKRKVLITLVIFSLTSSVFLPSASSNSPDITKYAWPPIYNTGITGQQPLIGYSFALVDDFSQSNGGEEVSFIRILPGSQRWCKDFKDPQCLKELENGKGNFWTNQVLPPCETESELINCIEAVNLISKEGKRERLVFEKLIPGNTWPEETSPSVEAGSSSSRWIRNVGNSEGQGFKVTVSGGLQLTGSSRGNISRATLRSFQASVEQYEVIKGAFAPFRIFESSNGLRSYGGNSPNYCIWVDTSECGVLTEFPEELKIELVLHLPREITGWLLGRVDQPIFDSKPLGKSRVTSQDLNRITISAFPIEVPLITAKVELTQASAELNNYYQANPFCRDRLSQCTGYFGGSVSASNFEYSYEIFRLFEPHIEDKAKINLPRWSIKSLSFPDKSYERCRSFSQNQINGIVATNASIYQGAPPTFDGDQFTYKVAGVHKLSDDRIFKGSYDLVLQSSFARCLYGFSNSPIKATVEVTNSDGSNNVVTNTFSEKNNWIQLSVKGFTFSQPTIKTKFVQEKAIVNPSPTPTISATPSYTPPVSTIKKTTISCVKGKITKKVTAVSPKCPAGYKKK
jgi:hypothetical protein